MLIRMCKKNIKLEYRSLKNELVNNLVHNVFKLWKKFLQNGLYTYRCIIIHKI